MTVLLFVVQVRFEAVKAAVAFIVANDDDKTILAHFKSLLSPLLAVCACCFGNLCHVFICIIF